MFAKLAQFALHGVGSVQRTWPTGGDRTRHHADCRPLDSRRTPRPILVCRWRKAPTTGALECVWRSVAAPAIDEPRPARSPGEVRRLTDARAAARRPFRRAAA